MPSSLSCASSTGAGAPVSGVGARGGLREGDHVADRVGAGEPLDDAVEPVGDAAVRRRAVAQRLEQEAEARLGFLGVDPERGEDLLLHVGAVDADRAAAHLLAVPDQVVGERAGGAGIVGVELAGGRRERVVQRVPALLARFHSSSGQSTIQTSRSLALRDQLEALGEVDAAAGPAPRWRPGAGRRRAAAGRPPRRRGARLSSRQLGLGEELGGRRAPALALAEGPDQALGAELLGARDQAVELGARQLAPAGVEPADRAAADSITAAEDLELGLGQGLGEVDQLEAEAQVGPVGAEAVHRLVVGEPLASAARPPGRRPARRRGRAAAR